MNSLIIFAVAVLVLVGVVKILKDFWQALFQESTNINKSTLSGYRKRESVMNKSEQAFFYELKKQLPNGYHVFPNMRLADILNAVDGPGFYARNNKLMPRHIDFLICDRYFKPVVAIEVNGSSHHRADRIKIDEEKREIFKDAQLPIEFIDVGTSFEESVAKVKNLLTS